MPFDNGISKMIPERVAIPLLLSMVACESQAQPTLTSGQLAFQVGEHTDYQGCLPTIWPEDGAAVTWNYADLTCFAGGFDNIVDPAQTAGASYYPTATAVNGDLNGGLYYRSTTSSEEYIGYYLPPGDLGACSDPRIDWQYPFTYGDSFSDELLCNEQGVMPRIRSGSQSISCTGYGTLVLPNGTFNDCLLFTRTWNYADDYGIPGSEGTLTGEARLFVQPGNSHVLLSFTTSSYAQAGQTLTSTGISLLDPTTTGSVNTVTVTPDRLLVMPNPASGPITLLRTSDAAAALELLTMDGRRVFQDRLPAGSTRHTLLPETLGAGQYVLRVVSSDGVAVVTFVVE
jgi:hypothetical protein